MSEEICPVCGLPKSLCVCKVIEREAKIIKISTTLRKFGKPTTIIEGIDEKSAKSVSKQLKTKLACGGTYKKGKIELQGDHKIRTKQLLKEMGYDEDQIEIS
ncbi:MAG: stress response translation initiation inhibitor YciH [Candidatus Aenigmarchaeota archaeon]|nr:stress response translation initiation inhibitor YciH [Candidatus Aenigmarchaeota archaeon]